MVNYEARQSAENDPTASTNVPSIDQACRSERSSLETLPGGPRPSERARPSSKTLQELESELGSSLTKEWEKPMRPEWREEMRRLEASTRRAAIRTDMFDKCREGMSEVLSLLNKKQPSVRSAKHQVEAFRRSEDAYLDELVQLLSETSGEGTENSSTGWGMFMVGYVLMMGGVSTAADVSIAEYKEKVAKSRTETAWSKLSRKVCGLLGIDSSNRSSGDPQTEG